MTTWSKQFSDDSYFNWIESNQQDTPMLFFETETFQSPVVYKILMPEEIKEQKYVMHQENEQHILLDIMEKTPFDELNSYDREILWQNRQQVIGMPKVSV